jgi:hypothetical protein
VGLFNNWSDLLQQQGRAAGSWSTVSKNHWRCSSRRFFFLDQGVSDSGSRGKGRPRSASFVGTIAGRRTTGLLWGTALSSVRQKRHVVLSFQPARCHGRPHAIRTLLPIRMSMLDVVATRPRAFWSGLALVNVRHGGRFLPRGCCTRNAVDARPGYERRLRQQCYCCHCYIIGIFDIDVCCCCCSMFVVVVNVCCCCCCCCQCCC